jgi:hypothetical protein
MQRGLDSRSVAIGWRKDPGIGPGRGWVAFQVEDVDTAIPIFRPGFDHVRHVEQARLCPMLGLDRGPEVFVGNIHGDDYSSNEKARRVRPKADSLIPARNSK